MRLFGRKVDGFVCRVLQAQWSTSSSELVVEALRPVQALGDCGCWASAVAESDVDDPGFDYPTASELDTRKTQLTQTLLVNREPL